MNRTQRRGARLLLVVAALLATVGQAGCSDGDDGSDNGDAAAATTTTAAPGAVTTNPPVVQEVTDSPRTENYEGALEDVTDLTCEQDGGLWRVGGTVTNATFGPADYRIFTAFLDDAGETLGLLQTDVTTLEPGEARPWSGDLALDADGLTCALRVERTAPGTP